MAKIIVFVSGGNVQDFIADVPGTKLMLVDNDNEEDDPSPTRSFVDVRCDKDLFDKTVTEPPGPRKS